MSNLENKIGFTFEQFVKTMSSYKANKTQKYLYVVTKSGIWAEIKPDVFTVGRYAENFQAWHHEFKIEYPESRMTTVRNDGGRVHIKHNGEDILSKFVELVNFIENMKSKGTAQSRHPWTGMQCNDSFWAIAMVFKTSVDVGAYPAVNRVLFDSIDAQIAINEPSKTRTYREHVVPCSMLLDEVIRMFKVDNASVDEVAEMLRKNLAIQYITPEDAAILDYDMGLKTTMPDGWKFGDDITARIKALNEFKNR